MWGVADYFLTVSGSFPCSSSFSAICVGWSVFSVCTKLGAPIDSCRLLAPRIRAFSYLVYSCFVICGITRLKKGFLSDVA